MLKVLTQWKGSFRLLVLLCLFWLPACSTIVEGDDQTITVTTNPSGASCLFRRDGHTVGVVNPTPGSTQVEKSKHDITVRCSKEKHEDTVGVLSSSFENMTFGNIIFGGLIGVAVDAGSGALHEYPPSISLDLPPISFDSIADRDSYYDRAKAKLMAEAAKTVSQIHKNCPSDSPDKCKAQVEAIERSRDIGLSDLEAKKQRARISGG